MPVNRNILVRTVFMLALIMILPLFILSCTSSEPASQQPQPELPATSSPSVEEPSQSQGEPVPVTGWQADGVISDGEYSGSQSYNNYELRWTADNQYIYIAMKAKTDGWVAIALQPGSTMKDADIVSGFVQDGKTTVYDQYSTGNFGPHAPDTELGGQDDILESGGSEEDGYTIIEFKRKLDTGDSYDHVFTRGKNGLLWAYGSGDNPEQKHSARGYGELEL